jgi:hypothetical protein
MGFILVKKRENAIKSPFGSTQLSEVLLLRGCVAQRSFQRSSFCVARAQTLWFWQAGAYILCVLQCTPVRVNCRKSKWYQNTSWATTIIRQHFGLRSLQRWDHGFEPHSRHGCVSEVSFIVRSSECRGLAMGWSPIQGALTKILKESLLYN